MFSTLSICWFECEKNIKKGAVICSYFGPLAVGGLDGESKWSDDTIFFGCLEHRAIKPKAQPFLKVEG
jgi:hypothetical protein